MKVLPHHVKFWLSLSDIRFVATDMYQRLECLNTVLTSQYSLNSPLSSPPSFSLILRQLKCDEL